MTYTDYKEEIDLLEDFSRILDECHESSDFSLNCALNSIPDWATKDFFDNVLFKFLMTPKPLHGKALALKIHLKSKLPKLNAIYSNLLENLD